MMGFQSAPQSKLFYIGIDLDKKVRKNHPLRKINKAVDFDFIYSEVNDRYGNKGNVSVPPTIILKLILLLVFYNVRSERELMETLPERIDWLWFLGYDLDAELPDHSVLSKARKRWGVEAFKAFFERIVYQCVEAGLVDGEKIFIDSSLIEADASNNSVVDTHCLKRHLNKRYRELEQRLEDKGDDGDGKDASAVNKRYVSTTDNEAAIVRQGAGKPKLTYKAHRAVDTAHEIITATEVTSGDVSEAHKMITLMDSHHDNTGRQAQTVVADSIYGTVENFLTCHDRGVKAHMPDMKAKQDNKGARKGIYGEDKFTYDRETDTYLCPSGVRLKRKSLHENRQSVDYGAPKMKCVRCSQRQYCTRNKSGRTIKRHLKQEELDLMRKIARSAAAKKDIRTRQHLMERSFARGKRYGNDQSRWRGLWRNRIQEYVTAAIQNIEVLIRYAKGPGKVIMKAPVKGVVLTACFNLFSRLKSYLSLKEISVWEWIIVGI